MEECCGLDCVIAHSDMDFRKGFSERIATYFSDGMTLHTGIHTIFAELVEKVMSLMSSPLKGLDVLVFIVLPKVWP